MFAALRIRPFLLAICASVALSAPTAAGPYVLIEADTGKIVAEQEAGKPWHPASITKLMTTYVAFRAIRDGRLHKYSLLPISQFAASTPPSKAGFPAGQTITVDNAIKLLMVKSANDMAVVIAEGVSGSQDAFVGEMNATAQLLGMSATRFRNPHGLPDDEQVTTARDMALLAQAILRDFPEHEMYFRIPTLQVGKRTMKNYNRLIDRYPGADGMKTGFICASGFNLVASAHRGNRKLIAVVLGSPNAVARAEQAAMLFERGFQPGFGLDVLLGGSKNVSAIDNLSQDPVSMWEQMCGKKRNRRVAASDSGDEHDDDDDPMRAGRANLLNDLPPSMPPIRVHTGPARDERGRPIRVALVNGRMEVVPQGYQANAASPFAPLPDGFGPQSDAEAEKPLRLPRVAPMPRPRPDRPS
ncbi:MAG TPA: D-alanyl-D-alanine carboxypeptidase family protein [Xanthobacteraceae bacterium]|nr:D-alanyl-D-alanine carboxypeptidase family protein [Xanthobacteraceae bacterium]